MFGFLIGTACLFGAFVYARRHRHGWHGHHRCGPRGRWAPHHGDHHDHHGPWQDHGGWDAGWEGRGSRMRSRGMDRMVGWIASRLEATPEQYRVIRNEVEQFMDKTHELRRELRLSRDDIAKAMSGPSFDEEIMGESFARQDERIRELRTQLVGALARIHDVLDPRQRDRLVELTNRFGPRRAW